MFNFTIKEKIEKAKVQAAMWGAKFDDEITSDNLPQKKEDLMMFRDPKEYNNLSEDERKELTRKMMSQHKNWVGERESKKIVRREI